MSTRCIINFGSTARPVEAKIYRHSDGYPDKPGVLYDLQRFFKAVQKDTKDTRFSDACYLAAKFVVWQAHEYAHSYKSVPGKDTLSRVRNKRLNFLSVGVMMENPGDIEYEYFVNCDVMDTKGFPTVTYTVKDVP